MTETIELPTVEITWPPDKHPLWGQYPINAGPPAPSYGFETGTPLHIYQGPPPNVEPTQHSAFSSDAWHDNLHGLPFVWPPATPPAPRPKLAPWDGPPTTFPFLRPAPDTRTATTTKPVHHILLAMLGTSEDIHAHEFDDLTDSLTHHWINTFGLYGPLSVPLTVVSPTNPNIPANMFNPTPFANTSGDLFGQTFRTPGMLLDW